MSGPHTDVVLVIVETPNVADAIVLSHAEGALGNNVHNKSGIQALDIADGVDGILPALVDAVELSGIRDHSLVSKLYAARNRY